MITDFYGRTHTDDLAAFAQKFINSKINDLGCYAEGGQHVVEGVTGLVLYRDGNYQVQLFLIAPDCVIPDHAHPNVDSFEVLLRGMKFTHNGRMALSMKRAQKASQNGNPVYQGEMIRVLPGEYHGGTASSEGGAFLSIQKWNNGITPSTVGDDWKGKTMGPVHDSRLETEVK